jgi:hypothetical protein
MCRGGKMIPLVKDAPGNIFERDRWQRGERPVFVEHRDERIDLARIPPRTAQPGGSPFA